MEAARRFEERERERERERCRERDRNQVDKLESLRKKKRYSEEDVRCTI